MSAAGCVSATFFALQTERRSTSSEGDSLASGDSLISGAAVSKDMQSFCKISARKGEVEPNINGKDMNITSGQGRKYALRRLIARPLINPITILKKQ